jgi:hypothetical protein
VAGVLRVPGPIDTLVVLPADTRGRRTRHGKPVAAGRPQPAADLGRVLFEALFGGDLDAAFRMCLQAARYERKILRIVLRIGPPELVELPWEYLFDARRQRFLCLSDVALVRYMPLPQPVRSLAIQPPVRVLGMGTSPSGVAGLGESHERALMTRALAELGRRGLVELSWVPGERWQDLREALRDYRSEWHILHFIGHGRYDQETMEGLLTFADDAGGAEELSARAVAQIVADHESLRLVVLNACEGARGSPREPVSSLACVRQR